MGRVLVRAAVSVVVLALVFVAVVGYAHTPPGRPLKMWMGRAFGMTASSCPLGYDVAQSPEEKAAARKGFALSHRGEQRAAARPALGFELDHTSRDDVTAWAERHGVHCERPRSGPDLECANVPAEAIADGQVPPKSLWFSFDQRDRLVALVAVRKDGDAERISSAFLQLGDHVKTVAGAPAQVDGDGSAARLRSGLLVQSTVEFRFADYYAIARTSNVGDGFVMTEEYRSLVTD